MYTRHQEILYWRGEHEGTKDQLSACERKLRDLEESKDAEIEELKSQLAIALDRDTIAAERKSVSF